MARETPIETSMVENLKRYKFGEKTQREKDKRIEMRKSRFCKTGKRKNLTERLKKNEDLKEILTMI